MSYCASAKKSIYYVSHMTEKEFTMIAWGRVVLNSLNGFSSRETGLVRLFRTEYSKDYKHFKSMGYEINDNFVKGFLRARK